MVVCIFLVGVSTWVSISVGGYVSIRCECVGISVCECLVKSVNNKNLMKMI